MKNSSSNVPSGWRLKLHRALSLALSALLLASSIPAAASAQTPSNDGGAARKPPQFPIGKPEDGKAYIIYFRNGQMECRDATPAERLQIQKRNPNVRTSPVRSLRDADGIGDDFVTSDQTTSGGSGSGGSTFETSSTTSAVEGAGLDIILRATTQLQNNPTALAAFERAAAEWEAIITSDITIVIDADFGTTRFGEPFPDNVLASTSGNTFFSPDYPDLRARLIGRASSAEESGLYNTLPQGTLPTDKGAVGKVSVETPVARALGLWDAHANPSATPDPRIPGGESIDAIGNAPSIGFNSGFNYDFNPDDGILPGRLDFNAVVIHEIGHVLGFTSEVGLTELFPQAPVRASSWDLFRLRPGMGGQFSTAQRILSVGGDHVHFDGAPELGLSTGGPDGKGGDDNQASHWKADELSGINIGIMDPTLTSGVRGAITNHDRRAINFFGYQVGAGPPAPANDNFANAITLQGATGSVAGTNVSATKEAGEPNHASNPGGRSVWYNWTATGTGSVTIDTRGSSYDTTLAVYVGASVNALSLQAGNDDIGGTPHDIDSSVTFNVTAGTLYRIAVDGFDADFGTITLTWSGPSAPTPTSSFQFAASVTANEFDGSAGFLVTRTGVTSSTQTVTFSTTGGGTAAPGSDYQTTTQQLVFNPGDTYKIGTVEIVKDTGVDTLNETVNVALSAPTGGAALGTPSTATLTIVDDEHFAPNSVGFAGSALQTVDEAATKIDLTVTRAGDTGAPASINYRTFVGTAIDTRDYIFASGTLRFAVGQTSKTFSVLITDDVYVEGATDETFTVQLSDPIGTSIGNGVVTVGIRDNDTVAGAPHPNDDSRKFVAQHYNDFLNRVGDEAGITFWANKIENCTPQPQCRERERINDSAAFFLAIEFQETGYLVYRLYKAAYGNMPGAPVPVSFKEFMHDSQAVGAGVIVGPPGWQQALEANKQAFVAEFVARGRFKTALPESLTPTQFVDALIRNTEALYTDAERSALINLAATNRAAALRQVAEDQTLKDQEFRKAFVLMQYFGYLRRSPTDPDFRGIPDPNYLGFNFWLTKLNQFNGNHEQAQMVKAFLDSFEYRDRFGP